MSNTLTFNANTLTPVVQNGVTYLTSSDLAKALGYKSYKSVTNLYNANKEEFSDEMSVVIKSKTKGFGNGNSTKAVRYFTLRGCHLISMFSRTPIAKEFRKWTLDTIHENKKPAPIENLSRLEMLKLAMKAEEEKQLLT